MLFKGLTPPAIYKFVFVNCLYPKFRWLYLLACISYICSDTTAFCTETTHVVAAFSRASPSFSRWFAKTWISGLIFATKLVRAPGRLKSTLIGWSGGRMMPWKLLWGSRPALLFLRILISDPSFALGHVVKLVRLKIIQSALYCDSSLSPMKTWCNVGQFNEGAFRLNNYIIPSQ